MSADSSFLCVGKKFEGEGGCDRKEFARAGKILCVIFEVLVGIVEELKKGRSFRCVQTSGRGDILVRMIFPGELPIVDFDLRFGCSQAKAEDGE
jgi:hypothetical protein